MPNPAKSDVNQLPANASLSGEDLRLQLECPKCKTPSWVAWRQLPHLLRCPGCRNSFWISKTGHIESQHECGTIQIACPRCQQKHAWPADAPLKHIRCRGCSFDIVLEQIDAPGMGERLAGTASSSRVARKAGHWEPKPLSRSAIIAVAIAVCGFIGLIIAGITWVLSPDRALLQRASKFTVASALGDSDKAMAMVVAGQDSAYQRWLSVNFASRSINSSDRLEVGIKDYSSNRAIVRATLGRGPKDRLVLEEVWRRASDGNWQFDADATLSGDNVPTSN